MKERKHIKLLPVAVANKIAAGEVVERPASVVKEFMENAFDAEATRVVVSIEEGGRKLISIADNGTGMEHDDALMCLEPQATSKISDVDDIEKISTYGFRGEAVPSVAAVSRLTIKTAVEGEGAGTCVEVEGGKVRSVSSIGFPQGTTFEIRDLFFNVPARRKFLKSQATEQSHIRTVFNLQALCHPEASLKLQIEGRDVVSLAGGASLKERIHDLFGAAFLEMLRPVEYKCGVVSVSGFVGLPSLTRGDRSEQYVFINKRAASAPIIPYALKEAYPPLDGDRKPIAILFIDVPPTEVDVNVHPTKREVRFRDARGVRDAIILAVQKALGIGSFANMEFATGIDNETGMPNISSRPPVVRQPAAPYGGAPMDLPPPQVAPAPSSKYAQTSLLELSQDGDSEVLGNAPSQDSIWSWCRILGQIQGGYVILETDEGFVVLDPKAAHERVLYDRMVNGLSGKSESQPLLLPETVALPPLDAGLITENLDSLRAMGFGIDIFGDNAFVIEALPLGIEKVDLRSFLSEVANGLSGASVKKGVPDWKARALAQSAALSAVSRMETIPDKALSKLVDDLSKTSKPYTSPRGKPTMFFTSTRELDRRFGIVN